MRNGLHYSRLSTIKGYLRMNKVSLLICVMCSVLTGCGDRSSNEKSKDPAAERYKIILNFSERLSKLEVAKLEASDLLRFGLEVEIALQASKAVQLTNGADLDAGLEFVASEPLNAEWFGESKVCLHRFVGANELPAGTTVRQSQHNCSTDAQPSEQFEFIGTWPTLPYTTNRTSKAHKYRLKSVVDASKQIMKALRTGGPFESTSDIIAVRSKPLMVMGSGIPSSDTVSVGVADDDMAVYLDFGEQFKQQFQQARVPLKGRAFSILIDGWEFFRIARSPGAVGDKPILLPLTTLLEGAKHNLGYVTLKMLIAYGLLRLKLE